MSVTKRQVVAEVVTAIAETAGWRGLFEVRLCHMVPKVMVLIIRSVAFFVLLIAAAVAQQQPSGSSGPLPSAMKNGAENPAAAEAEEPLITIRRLVNEVNLVFTVTDRRGQFVRDLSRKDLRILDDGAPPESVMEFRSETGLPLRVGLIIDASGSIRNRFRFEQEAAIRFLEHIVRPHSDRAFVIGFDSGAEVMQDFTNDLAKLSHGVRMLRPGGGTALYDAVFFACRDKLMKADDSGASVRRTLIVISDGEDNQSRVTREEAISMAHRANVIVYAVSTNDSNVKLRGDKVLERFAESTGGRAFFPYKISEVEDAFSRIEEELRSQYVLAYKPANFEADGRFRKIELEVIGGKNYRVRARQGYYAPTTEQAR
ncbi:MAG: VWA domain-containing protein [Candidatus Korobacteraceae bacterium]